MKRNKLWLAVLTGVSILLLTGCGQELGEEFTEEVNTLEDVVLTVDEDSVTSEGITFTISNQSDKDLNYGQDYSLLKDMEGFWYIVEPDNPVAITLELLWIPAGNTDTHEISWGDSYGKLSAGHYRIIKRVADNEAVYYLAGEFNIK